ncbi:YfiR family protein [Roseateles sp. BYS78W]|uniref:YfiR family protein n=1 Tax=Pelomonas candidula TaxID=3299025 RepID=A0ABW7HEB5_9BURK
MGRSPGTRCGNGHDGAILPRRRLLVALLAAAGVCHAIDDDDGRSEYQVKAAFVCRFGNYVEWPAQALGAADEPFRVGVLAGSAVVEEFRRVAATASVAGHPVEVRRLASGEAPEGVHVLFVSRAMAGHAGEALAAVQGRPVLTVTELDPDGTTGMINFVLVDDRVRFDVLLPPATQSGLRISVRLLGVARRVEGKS